MAQRLRLQALNREVPGSNMLTAALYLTCLVPRKGLKPLVHMLLADKQLDFSQILSVCFLLLLGFFFLGGGNV